MNKIFTTTQTFSHITSFKMVSAEVTLIAMAFAKLLIGFVARIKSSLYFVMGRTKIVGFVKSRCHLTLVSYGACFSVQPTYAQRKRALFVCFGFLVFMTPVAAAPRTWQGTLDDSPTWITVVPRGLERDLSELPDDAWWTWGNATSDAYVFAFNQPDNVRLVVAFDEVDGKPQASFYINEGGTLPVDVVIQNNDIQVTSTNGFPHMVTTTKEGGWFVDGYINYNLITQRDGLSGKERVPLDGEFDYIIESGEESPGVAGWETRKLLNDPQARWGYPRFGASVRMPGAGEFITSEPLIPDFPHLGVGNVRSRWYELNPHPFYYHIEREDFSFNSTVGFYNGGIYRVNSLSHAPEVDFESPFATYNLEPGSRETRLVIRAGSFPADGLFGPEPKQRTRTSLRYSWKLFDDRNWDYGIHVAGPLVYEDKVQIGSDTIVSVEPERFPKWVANSHWPLVTFVEPPEGYGGSEGIYFYSAQADEYQSWLAGIDNHEPATLAAPYLLNDTFLNEVQALGLPPGFRGEYHSAYFRAPRLYVSPIDERLHLEHAMGGVWNLGEGRILRTQNLNQDAYLDTWTLETITARDDEQGLLVARPGIIEEAIYTFDDYIIYSSLDSVEIHRTAFDKAEFVVAPPTDPTSWQEHRRLLDSYREGRPVDNMRSWLDAFSGETLTIEGAQVRGMRTTDTGFHFSLVMNEGADVRGDLTEPLFGLLIEAGSAEAGVYALSYNRDTDSWQREYATPARLIVELLTDTPQVFVPQQVTVTITNEGIADWFGPAELRIGDETIFVWETLLVPGRDTVSQNIVWTPRQQGDLPLVFTANAPLTMPERLYVQNTPRVSFNDALWLPTRGYLRYIIMMAVALCLMTLAFWRTWKTA
jgi:hypothetical protein